MKSYFVTHPEVEVDPEVPIEQWKLSARGQLRAARISESCWDDHVTQIFSSTEQKAVESASVLSRDVGVGFECLAELGENDRSATGFLPPAEFEATADEFFAHPDVSVRGWETAAAAQSASSLPCAH